MKLTRLVARTVRANVPVCSRFECQQMFRALVLALALGVASAFVPAAHHAARTSPMKVTQEELQDLAESNRDALGAYEMCRHVV